MSDLINYQVMYFGLLAERRGLADEFVASAATTTADLYAELDAAHALGLATANLRVAVNDEFESWGHRLRPGDCVAFLPPMSGG